MLRYLSQGMNGPDVKAVQQGLNLRKQPNDVPLVEDGAFGPKTDAAVRRFQQRSRIAVDGIVGPITRAALFPLAVVTVSAYGMRLRRPSLFSPRTLRPNLMPGRLNFGDPPPSPAPGPLPPPLPVFSGFQPVSYPGLRMPIFSPFNAPAPLLTLPVHHFEIQPGTSVSLGKPADVSFSLTLSGVVMIGPEDARHQEFSSGIITSTPGVFQGGDWTVGWFAQLTHVEQLGRSGNFSWQPNAQIVAGNGSARPFLSATASPANVQFDVNKSLSLSLGGPSVTATFTPDGAAVSWGLASFGLVGKF